MNIIQTRIPNRRATPAERARLDRVRAIVTAVSEHPRSFRLIDGLGTAHRVKARSACEAVDKLQQLGLPRPGFDKLEVIANGGWTWVI